MIEKLEKENSFLKSQVKNIKKEVTESKKLLALLEKRKDNPLTTFQQKELESSVARLVKQVNGL